MRSKARYCVNCGKKFYPNSYMSYPQSEYEYHTQTRETIRHEVEPMHKHFHSQGCMKEWIAKHSREFSNLIDNISHNVIQDNNNQSLTERINNGSE